MPHALETQPERDGSPETDANVGGDSAVDSDTASIASTLKGVVDADVAEDLVQRLLDNLPKPELSPLCEKEEQFSNYIGKRVKTFTSDIVKPLVSSLEQLGSQMNKDRLKEHLNGYATMLEEVLFGDKETDKPPPEGKRAKPANHVLAKFLRAGAPHPEGKSGEALQKAWSESLDIFADDITDEIRKTMPVAKKIAWKNFVRPKLDNTRSIELGDHLVICFYKALADANPEKVAAEAYKKQKTRYRESQSVQGSAARSQSTALDRTPISQRPVWMRDEARRHLDAGGSFGQYSAACDYEDLADS